MVLKNQILILLLVLNGLALVRTHLGVTLGSMCKYTIWISLAFFLLRFLKTFVVIVHSFLRLRGLVSLRGIITF